MPTITGAGERRRRACGRRAQPGVPRRCSLELQAIAADGSLEWASTDCILSKLHPRRSEQMQLERTWPLFVNRVPRAWSVTAQGFGFETLTRTPVGCQGSRVGLIGCLTMQEDGLCQPRLIGVFGFRAWFTGYGKICGRLRH